ncbi:MAG TPA: arylsulfatase [Chryseosolibacter sp.]|nr:arylsulfatase [Chryseosolibacter sp.]
MKKIFAQLSSNRQTPIRRGAVWIILIEVLLLATIPSSYAQRPAKPNIIVILADDLGYGDLSCYGQKRFQTPNIDKLAREGMMFTNHYSGSPVCAPSRSALMTGLHTGHTYVRGNKEVQPEGQVPLPDDAYTVTEMLRSAGYATGVFGKWGLGYPDSEGAPENQGVDEFFGYNCQRLAHNYFPEYLWDNESKTFLEGNKGTSKGDYAPEIIHKRALKFLDDHHDGPFFLFYPMIMPHAELVAPEDYMTLYRGKFLPEKSFQGVDAGDTFRKGPYGSQPEAHAAFAAMVHLIDVQVGNILDKVAALGLDENTLIIFSSDNGPHVEGGADPDFFDSNGILRGYKRDLYEGGIRVPMIARWKRTIEPGQVTDHVSAFWDMMPTFAELTKIKIDKKIDGLSFLPTLLGNSKQQQQHHHLYWEVHELGGRMALRKGPWKLVRYDVAKDPPGEPELYNLKDDPSEKNNVAKKYPRKVDELKTIMRAERIPSELFPLAIDNK